MLPDTIHVLLVENHKFNIPNMLKHKTVFWNNVINILNWNSSRLQATQTENLRHVKWILGHHLPVYSNYFNRRTLKPCNIHALATCNILHSGLEIDECHNIIHLKLSNETNTGTALWLWQLCKNHILMFSI